MYPRSSPQRVLLAHPSNEVTDLTIDPRAATTSTRFPAPTGAEAAPVPADHVSSLTTVIAFRIEGSSRHIQTKISRSMFRSDTLDPDLRLRTITCCRRTMFSASSLARDFSRVRATSSSLIRNLTIGQFEYHSPTGPSSGLGFRYRQPIRARSFPYRLLDVIALPSCWKPWFYE